MESISDWYEDQHVLITGATGFMGKILVEKILRSCPKVAAVYILVRSKRGKETGQRMNEFLKSPVFDKLRNTPQNEDIFKKLKCIDGDVTEVNCGLSPDDQTVLNKSVTAVFHMAATVRFDQPLKTAILLNTGGTLNILELACNFQALKIFVHVSTSYCHCNVRRVEEKLYKAPHDPRKMLDLAKCISDDVMETFSPFFLKGHPNTYSYTKSLAEQLVSEYNDKLPIVITRPSIVVAAYKDPIPGWVDNMNGPTGLLVGAGKGVIRTMHCNEKLDADFITADIVINTLLIIAWKVGSEPRREQAEVYHITPSKKKPVSWEYAMHLGRKYLYEYPFSVCLWYPGGTTRTNYYVYVIDAFFSHWIPAFLVDMLATLTGNKPFLVKIQIRVVHGIKVMQYYTTRPWYFHNEKFSQLYNSISKNDQEIFYADTDIINTEEYMRNYMLAARKYCVHEDLDTLPHARKISKRLYYLDVLKNILLLALLLWIAYKFIFRFMEMGESKI